MNSNLQRELDIKIQRAPVVRFVVDDLDAVNGGPSYSIPSIAHSIQRLGAEIQITTAGLRVTQAIAPANLVHNFGMWKWKNQEAVLRAILNQTPIIWSPLGMLLPWSLEYKKLKKKLAWLTYQRILFGKSSVLHATSHQELEALTNLNLKIPVALIPHGMDLPAQSVLPKKGDTGHNIKRLLFLSRINPKKGLLDLVAACQGIPATNWELVIAGPDENGYRSVVEKAVIESGLQQRIKFIGPVYGSNKEDLFKSANIFVLPTYSENFGLAIAEALAYGVPVITTTGTPWGELHKHQCGWWVRPGVAELEDVLKVALSMSNNDLIDMGVRGRDLIESKYSWDICGKRHLENYQWLLGAGPRPEFVVG